MDSILRCPGATSGDYRQSPGPARPHKPHVAGDNASMESMPSFAYQRFETRTDARSAFDTAIEMAQRTIRLFDRDGSFYGLERPVVAGHFDQLLRRNPQTTVEVILKNVRNIRSDCPRILELMQRHGERIQVRRLDEQVRGFERSYLLIDKSLVMRRPHFNRMVTFWDVDEQEINATERLFSELAENAPELLSVNVTGL